MINGFFAGFAVAILLWFLAFLYLKAFVRRRTSPDYILDLLQEEVLQLTADIDEKTEQNLQLVEEKISALREVCSEAERRIAVYNRELEKHDNETQALTILNNRPLIERLEVQTGRGRQIPAGSIAKTVEAAYRNPLQKTVEAEVPLRIETRKPHRQVSSSESNTAAPVQSNIELSQSEQKAAEHIPAVPQEQALPINITKSREPLAFKPRPMKERIAELQKAGFAPDYIAKRLRISLSEVQLYFNFAEKPK